MFAAADEQRHWSGPARNALPARIQVPVRREHEPRSVFITKGAQLAMGFLGSVPYTGQLDGGMASVAPGQVPSHYCSLPVPVWNAHTTSGMLGQNVHVCDITFSA